ncbi:MAG: hypothetical protein C0599_13340, partial [Salinivirgaceae bacterium]
KDFAITDIQFIDVDHGLSSSYILSIFEDSRNVFWFGTYEGGLIRYNGHFMYNFTTEHGLPGNSIRSIFEDSKGNMWFGTAGNGFCMYDGHKLHNFSRLNDLSQLYVFDIKEDSRGRVWITTRSQGVFVIEENTILHLDTSQNLPHNSVFTMYENNQEEIFLGTRNGMSILKNDSLVNYTFEGHKFHNHIKAFKKDNAGRLWIGTRRNPIIYLNGIFTEVKVKIHVKAFAVDSENKLWIATVDEGLFEVKVNNDSGWNGTYKKYTESHGLSHNYISDITYTNGYLWMGTYGGGINKLKIKGFNHITQEQGIESDLVWGFIEDQDQKTWLATETKGICTFNDSLYFHFSEDPNVLDSYIVISAFKDQNNNKWFGTYKGSAYRIENDNLYMLNVKGLSGLLSVISFMEDKNGAIWLGTFDQGAFKIEKDKIIQYNTQTGLLNNDVYDIFQHDNGTVWFATDEGLSILDENRIYNFTKQNGFSSDEIRNIMQDDDKNIWIGTFGAGVAILKNGRFSFIDESKGLSSNLITSIIQDNQKRIWVGTESGLNLLEKEKDDYNIINFDKSDGLKGLDFYVNSVNINSKNEIWWGTGKGITYLDLNNFHLDTTSFNVNIEAIQVKQQFPDFNNYLDSTRVNNLKGISYGDVKPFYNCPQYLSLPYQDRHITFYFASSNKPNVQNIKYISRLYPLEKEWTLPTEENKADYRGIPPGDYRFEVQAITINGVHSKIAVQHITIDPPWWMTPWMYALYILGLALIIGLLHRWRTSVLIRRQYELEKVVSLRTVEIQEKNEELNVLLDQITDQRNEIEAQRDTVLNQKNHIEQVNTEISHSIDYAQRIQSSLMPDYFEFKEVFEESFMIFKPRDIVSGDFFWWAEEKDKFISIVADCTGHGVPGAFMSILGITFLREIVLKEKITEPHEILNRLREEIIQALKQKNIPGELRDGIEMTVIVFDKDFKKASFAGAYNSIYHYNNGKLNELKGQKFPVAAYPGMKPFEKVEIQIKPGDSFYMFSDGYHDQFSEIQGKKIKKSRFFSLIESNVEKDMAKQKEVLVNFLHDWQGEQEQIDDILVLGFRIPNK